MSKAGYMVHDVAKHSIYGIIWILVNNLNLSIQSATIKELCSSLSSAQIVFLYKFVVWVCLFIWVAFTGFYQLKTSKIKLYFIRSFLSIAAALIYVKSLQYMPLANAVAIGFTEPLFVTLIAVIFLKEFLNVNGIIALIIGFIGAIITLRPGAHNFNIYSLWVLGAAIIWSFDNLAVKLLGRTEKSVQYLFYISLFATLLSAPIAIKEWKPLELWHLPWILVLASFYFIHLIAVFKAFQYANLSVLAPFDFSRILFSTIIGTVWFGDQIDIWSITGTMIITMSSAYIIWKKEHK
ncbi:EamA-like transporter family protein [Rickettsiales bacterium Ac37b]|nr:EamA-like transporter family protein [Rickettsiales bacterium Ac37b]